MLSKNNRHVINFALDDSFYLFDRLVKWTDSKIEDFCNLFTKKMIHDLNDDYIYESNHGKVPEKVSDEMIVMLKDSLKEAIQKFRNWYTDKSDVSKRLHRITIRDIFNNVISAKLKYKELCALEQAKKYLEKEKEKLAYGA